ncbi:Wadjet anti-phage system protein JetD domain-containing protein [Spirosoma litoris]
MISPDEVRRKAERWWLDVLRARLNGSIEGFFPKDIPQIGLDKAADKLARFITIREEQEALHQQSKAVRGFGYSLEWTTQGSKLVGQNAYITRIYLDGLEDFLKLTGKAADYAVFVQTIEQIQTIAPALLPLLERIPQLILEQADKWPDLLKVTAYFLQHPKPQQYVRSLPIAVPTKFIETNRPVLRILLDHLIPDHLNADETDFYKRFHVYVEEPLVKIRFLDASLRIHPALSHVSVWLSEFRALTLAGSRVFIIENLTSFLTFPNLPDSIAIWGGGFAVTLLGGTDWLHDKQLYYWGDLDAHGFQMLDQCRKLFPKAQSILMDRATFDAHKHLLTKGESTSVPELAFLTDEEQSLFQLLNRNGWRVEQERLGERWVREIVKEIMISY